MSPNLADFFFFCNNEKKLKQVIPNQKNEAIRVTTKRN